MIASDCPDSLDVLMALDGELSGRRGRRIRAHVLSCETCRTSLLEMSQTLALVHDELGRSPARVNGAGLRRLQAAISAEQEHRPASAMGSSRQWLVAAAATAAVTIAVMLTGRYTQTVRAEEILARAVAHEQALPATTVRRVSVRIQRAGAVQSFSRTISPSTTASSSTDPREEQVADLFAQHHFSWNRPLDIAYMRAWRSSLARATDHVVVKGEEMALQTTTPDGPLREVEFVVRRGDWGVARASWDFADLGRLEVIETERWTPGEGAKAAGSPVRATLPPTDRLLEPEQLERSELDARTLLHAAGLDSPAHSEVRRTQTTISVRIRAGAVSSTLRQQLRALPSVRLQLVSKDTKESPIALPGWSVRTFGERQDVAQEFFSSMIDDITRLQDRVAAFAALGDRYSVDVADRLSFDTRARLDRLVRVQYQDTISAAEDLDDRLVLFLGSATRRQPPPVPPFDWRSRARTLVGCAATLRHAVTALLAEPNLPTPNDLGVGVPEPQALTDLRNARNAWWDRVVDPDSAGATGRIAHPPVGW